MGHPTRWFISAVAFALLSHSPQPTGQAAGYELHAFCTGDVPSGQRTVQVANGAELQQALDQAVAGDVILLATGATFRPAAGEGSFVLRRRPIAPDSWITVRSADKAFDAGGTLPPATRVGKTHVDLMAKIRATGSTPAIKTEAGAHGYRLIGIDVGVDAAVSHVTNLIELGSGRDTSIDTEPSDIVIDRSYLHGNDSGSYRRGVAMNGIRLAVVDSYLENFHDANGDSQAIGGWNGPGPFSILRNVLEAASENVMFGGGDPAIPDLVPADIEVRGNLMTKRVAWKAAGVPVKNAFELKTARRVVVDGNTFEHVWASGQDGTAIVLKSVNQEGNCPWCVTEYVTFSNNVVTDAAHGVMINAVEVGAKGLRPPVAVNHVRLQNVLFQEIGGKLFRIMGGASDVAITHVTSLGSPSGILDPRDPNDRNPGLVFEDNIVERKLYGIGAGGDEGSTTLNRNFSPFTYNNNVLVNTSRGTDQEISDDALKARYPKSTAVAPGWTALGFQQGTYQPSAGNKYAAGERRAGVDMEAVKRAQQGSGGPGCGAAPKSAAQPPKP